MMPSLGWQYGNALAALQWWSASRLWGSLPGCTKRKFANFTRTRDRKLLPQMRESRAGGAAFGGF